MSMKKQSFKKRSGNKLLLHEKVKIDSEKEESNDGSVLSRSQTPIQIIGKSQLNPELVEKNEIHTYNIPEVFKDMLAQDWAQINVGKIVKTFEPIIISSDVDINNVPLTGLSISDILTQYINAYNKEQMDVRTGSKEPRSVQEATSSSPEESGENLLDGDSLVRISERSDFCRGLRLYLDTLFDKRLLYKPERPVYKRAAATQPKADVPQPVDSFIQPGSKKSGQSAVSGPSHHVGLVHLLRLLVMLPELLNESGLSPSHTQKICTLAQEFIDFLEARMSKN